MPFDVRSDPKATDADIAASRQGSLDARAPLTARQNIRDRAKRDKQIVLPLETARLGGTPSVRQVSARGHGGWTVWIAVRRVRDT